MKKPDIKYILCTIAAPFCWAILWVCGHVMNFLDAIDRDYVENYYKEITPLNLEDDQ